MPQKITEVAQYFARLTPQQANALNYLRAQIRAAAPDAEEYIGYQVPAFRQDGALVSYGAAKNHCAFYVQSPALMEQLAAELDAYDTSKATIRFKTDTPLPDALVTKIVKERLAQNAARQKR